MRSEGSGFKSSGKSFQQFLLKFIGTFFMSIFLPLGRHVIDLVDTNFSAKFKALSKLYA